MRKSAFAFLIAFMFLMVLFSFLFQSLFLVQQLAVLEDIQGRVEVRTERKRQWAPAEESMLVQPKDTVRTGADSGVVLRWVDGTRARLGPETQFTVKVNLLNTRSQERKTRMRIDWGQVWLRLIRKLNQGSKFEVETPSVVAAVRGTIFSVKVDKSGATEIGVYEGRVQVGRGDTFLGAGQTATGSRGQLLIEDQSNRQRAAWRKLTDIIGPPLRIESPVEGARVAGDSVTVSGRAEPDARVAVNGNPATVKRDGEFSIHLPVTEDLTEIEVVVTDARGAQTRDVRHVRPVAPQPSPVPGARER